MKTMFTPRLGLFSVIILIQAMLLGPAEGQIVADQSGSLLMNSVSNSAPSTRTPAVTLPEAISAAPIATESFSTIQYAPSEEPALILPVSSVFGPGPLGFIAMADEETDSFAVMSEVTPVPEPATWWAGLGIAILIRPLGKRDVFRRMISRLLPHG